MKNVCFPNAAAYVVLMIQSKLAMRKFWKNDSDIVEIQCNVILEDLEDGVYMSDFLCTKPITKNGKRVCAKKTFNEAINSEITGYIERLLVRTWY